jgi:hypothetical protein
VIEKMPAMLGVTVAAKVVPKIGHILAGMIAGEVTDPAVIFMSVASQIGAFGKQELLELQADALSVVREIKEVAAGQMNAFPVRRPNGMWESEGLEDDIVTVLALTVHSVLFTLSPFFEDGGSNLKAMAASFQGLFPQPAPT